MEVNLLFEHSEHCCFIHTFSLLVDVVSLQFIHVSGTIHGYCKLL